jgi:hypothetical protein
MQYRECHEIISEILLNLENSSRLFYKSKERVEHPENIKSIRCRLQHLLDRSKEMLLRLEADNYEHYWKVADKRLAPLMNSGDDEEEIMKKIVRCKQKYKLTSLKEIWDWSSKRELGYKKCYYNNYQLGKLARKHKEVNAIYWGCIDHIGADAVVELIVDYLVQNATATIEYSEQGYKIRTKMLNCVLDNEAHLRACVNVKRLGWMVKFQLTAGKLIVTTNIPSTELTMQDKCWYNFEEIFSDNPDVPDNCGGIFYAIANNTYHRNQTILELLLVISKSELLLTDHFLSY